MFPLLSFLYYIIYVSGAKILEEKIILDNKNISCFSIKFIKELTEYDMLSIYNELNRYCEKNNVWCMLFKWNNGVKKYLLIKKNIFHKTEDFSFILCSPINDFSSEKYFSKEKN